MLLLTLLLFGVVEVQRTWDLRSYTGDTLALLTGRSRAYGYFFTERFLADVARSNGAEVLTGALARWTTHLWQAEVLAAPGTPALFYVDGHRKPVYTDALIPRGLVGRLSTIEGAPNTRVASRCIWPSTPRHHPPRRSALNLWAADGDQTL